MAHQYVKQIVKKEVIKMKMLVEAVSKFGFKAVNNGESIWHNADKKAQPDLTPIRQGDEIEADVNGKWVKSFTIISRGNPVENKKPSSQSSSGPSNAYVQPVTNKESAEAALRSVAATVFGPVFAFYAANGDEAEAVQKSLDVVEKVQDFIANGRSK